MKFDVHAMQRAFNLPSIFQQSSNVPPPNPDHQEWGSGTGPASTRNPPHTPPFKGGVWLSGVTRVYRWLEGVQVIEFMTFNVESEFLSLFVHRFKRAESRDDLVVANLVLRQ